jgi:transcriptional regulator with XRE-family HTH domain
MADRENIYFEVSETVAPIFSLERGRRLELVRKSMLLDQAQLAERLGVTQQIISKLERGITPVSRKPIALAAFYRVFGCATHHILFGLDAHLFNRELINKQYWTEKDRTKGNRTRGRLRKRKSKVKS